MRFFLDENFPKSASENLVALGHQVFDLRGTSREGCADQDIFAEAQDHSAIFLTTDRDFFHTIPHLFEHHAGVVVIALRQPNREGILAKLEWILNKLSPSEFSNRTIQLRDHTWIAVPPIDSNG